MISRQLIVTAMGLLLVTVAYVGTTLSPELATSYGGYCVAVGSLVGAYLSASTIKHSLGADNAGK
jgi:hypothetical protein